MGVAGYLLDTNIISETRKARPDKRVIALLEAADASRLFLSVLTVGELRKGMEAKRRLDIGTAARIGAWIDDLETNFAGRILPIDATIAHRWGELSADRSRPVIDTLIAATAIVHGLSLVTRNLDDMRGIALSVVDPWTTGPAP
jgi:predicted nucleic acid-binding protein